MSKIINTFLCEEVDKMSTESSVSLESPFKKQSIQGVNQPFSHEPIFFKTPKKNNKNISKEENGDHGVDERYISVVW